MPKIYLQGGAFDGETKNIREKWEEFTQAEVAPGQTNWTRRETYRASGAFIPGTEIEIYIVDKDGKNA